MIRLIAAALLLALASCAGDAPLPLAQNVALDRYAGRWFVIANIPYFAERGGVGSRFDISFPEGRVLDIYTAQSHDFTAPPSSFTMTGYIVPGTNNAQWRETPLWPLYLSYLILHVEPDDQTASAYQIALVGYPGRGYGWVLSRSPDMDDATYRAQLKRFADAGYDPAQFRRVPQHPGQIGQPDFQ